MHMGVLKGFKRTEDDGCLAGVGDVLILGVFRLVDEDFAWSVEE